MPELEAGDAEGVWTHVVSPSLDVYASGLFEDICRDYLQRLSIKGALPLRIAKIGRWWNKDTELDIMAMDMDNKNLILGECKFKNTPFSLSEMKAAFSKYTASKDDVKTHWFLFSKSGFSSEVVKAAEKADITLIGVDDMFT